MPSSTPESGVSVRTGENNDATIYADGEESGQERRSSGTTPNPYPEPSRTAADGRHGDPGSGVAQLWRWEQWRDRWKWRDRRPAHRSDRQSDKPDQSVFPAGGRPLALLRRAFAATGRDGR